MMERSGYRTTSDSSIGWQDMNAIKRHMVPVLPPQLQLVLEKPTFNQAGLEAEWCFNAISVGRQDTPSVTGKSE